MAETDETPPTHRVTFTMSSADMERLAYIVGRRHPDDPRTASLTVRELIRAEYDRLKREEREQAARGQGSTGK